MTTTVNPTETPAAAEAVRPVGRGQRWPLLGAVAGVAAFTSIMVSMPGDLEESDYSSGVEVLDKLERGGYHAGFLLGLVAIGFLFAAAAGWRRWAERNAPDDLAARMVGQGLAATAAVNIAFVSLMGSMALYLPGGADEGWLSNEALFINWTLLDFGALLGWWGAAASAVAVAVLALRRRLLPRWMGVVSVLLLLPPVAMAVGMALPGMVGFTMPIWLVAISLGTAFGSANRTA